ncbi:FAD-dependent monooxygenase [Couchioplanes caeruleus]|uniref:FAD-dependent monooxygenase n=1 Tax=Couchioplanes caeruleus TaxID=56438 RepID=UPI00201CA6E6|nr:FAD-dependent monooxygenase [Couchioplanes caeruleus]UQU67379.1 FAD-dependent monooxygenase [Couchioplanes caeruleus]
MSSPITATRHHTTSGLRVAVVGGSLTGPTTALLLHHAGFDDVTLYEATPASAPLGGGLIGLEHSSLDILDQLGVPQHEFVPYESEAVMDISVCHRRPETEHRHLYAGRNTTWTLLHQALSHRLPAGILHTGKRVTGLTGEHGQPLLHFADGDNAQADLVIFADGRASTGRRLLDPHRQLHYAGYVAHRGQATSSQPGLRDFLRFEPDPRSGAQFNLAPIPGGTDWTFYLGATPDQYIDFFGAAPTRRVFALPQHVTPAARTAVDASARQLLPDEQAALVHDTQTRMAAAVMDIDPPTRMVWPVGTGHAVLIGDALAPVRPHTARGANNGIEQAAGLTAALNQHRKYGADLTTALDGWQHRHLPAAVASVQLGPKLGHRYGLGA